MKITTMNLLKGSLIFFFWTCTSSDSINQIETTEPWAVGLQKRLGVPNIRALFVHKGPFHTLYIILLNYKYSCIIVFNDLNH